MQLLDSESQRRGCTSAILRGPVEDCWTQGHLRTTCLILQMRKLAVSEEVGVGRQVQGGAESSLPRIGGRIEIGAVPSATVETHVGSK